MIEKSSSKWVRSTSFFLLSVSFALFQKPYLAAYCEGCAETSLPSNITVVKASEVDEIITGNEEKYKNASLLQSTTINVPTIDQPTFTKVPLSFLDVIVLISFSYPIQFNIKKN